MTHSAKYLNGVQPLIRYTLRAWSLLQFDSPLPTAYCPLRTMKAVVFEAFGDPAEVLRVRDVPDPHAGPGRGPGPDDRQPGQSVRPAGGPGPLRRPAAAAGDARASKGSAWSTRSGPGLLGRLVQGKRVTVINGAGGNWAEYAVIPARQARPVPDDIPDEQAATYFVNPATVLAMVRHVLKVRRGEWLLQSAAGSALGRMIIKLGRHDGFKTLNVVRRREAIDELKALGGDAVISSEDGPIDEQVRRIVGGDGVRHAIDPVGGETGTAVFRSLAADGRLLALRHAFRRADPDRPPAHDLGPADRRGVLARTLDARALDPRRSAPLPRDRRP